MLTLTGRHLPFDFLFKLFDELLIEEIGNLSK